MFPYNDSNKASEQINEQNQYINSALFPKSLANDNMSYKLAQNTSTNTASDVPNQSYVIRENIKFPNDEDVYMPLKSKSIYDTYVNHSPDEIARWLQEGLNDVTSQHVKVDPEGTVSVMGSETISALNNLTDYEKAKLDEYFLNRREEAWKKESPSYQNKFSGNLNRIQKLRKRHHGAGTY